ncbi:uncharacterized protein LOC142344003 isoform X2 [Convolutriloba macropyga]|uniref:uncharacterized protein LOC142344003 isoform X2 n=1 Tax=Convolutriloba macropyga TaxID=536237 RepID=UPI003F51D94F
MTHFYLNNDKLNSTGTKVKLRNFMFAVAICAITTAVVSGRHITVQLYDFAEATKDVNAKCREKLNCPDLQEPHKCTATEKSIQECIKNWAAGTQNFTNLKPATQEWLTDSLRQKYYIGCADNFDACNKQAGIQEGPLNTWLSANQSKVAYERDYDKLCKCVFYKQKTLVKTLKRAGGQQIE